MGRLAAALNAMLGRIEASYRAREDGEAKARDSEDRMRRFVADASHELRTPLTSVKGLAEFYLQQGEAADRAEVARLMTGIQAEAARMGRLVDDLLLLAQFDENRPLDLQPVDLSSIAVQAAAGAGAIQPGRPLTVLAGGAPDRPRRRRTAAPGPRQPDRQCPAAHARGHAGHRDRDSLLARRPGQRRRRRARAVHRSRQRGSSTGSTAPTGRETGPAAAPGSACPSRPPWSPRTAARSRSTPGQDTVPRSSPGCPWRRLRRMTGRRSRTRIFPALAGGLPGPAQQEPAPARPLTPPAAWSLEPQRSAPPKQDHTLAQGNWQAALNSRPAGCDVLAYGGLHARTEPVTAVWRTDVRDIPGA